MNHYLSNFIFIAALVASPAFAQAVEVSCEVSLNGKTKYTRSYHLKQVPGEGEGAAVGVIHQNTQAQIVVSTYPLQININVLFGGQVVGSTTSRFENLNSATVQSTIGDTLYHVACKRSDI